MIARLVTALLLVATPALADVPVPDPRPHPLAGATVVDGDTIRLRDGERVRLRGYDTPEIGGRCDCREECALGEEASRMLAILIARPDAEYLPEREPDGSVERDRFGRALARVTVNGEDVGAILIRAGLAREYVRDASGRLPRREGWCE